MRRKYEFTGETKQHVGRTLLRIRRLADEAIGGWIEKEDNLSHTEGAWVGDEAMVYGSAKVHGMAVVYGSAEVHGQAVVGGSAVVHGQAVVYGSAEVHGQAIVGGSAVVGGRAVVHGMAVVHDRAHVFDDVVSKSPAIFYLGVGHYITVTDNCVRIGCRQHSIDHWLENYRDIGKDEKYPPAHIELFGEQLRLIKKLKASQISEII